EERRFVAVCGSAAGQGVNEMESVHGISRPRRGAFRGAGLKLAPSSCYLPVEYAPPPRKGLGPGRPPASPPHFFTSSRGRIPALHEKVSRAMVTELNPVTSSVNSTANPNMRLLIIEDDRESADYLVKAFREVGHVADLASDGEEGLALAD